MDTRILLLGFQEYHSVLACTCCNNDWQLGKPAQTQPWSMVEGLRSQARRFCLMHDKNVAGYSIIFLPVESTHWRSDFCRRSQRPVGTPLPQQTESQWWQSEQDASSSLGWSQELKDRQRTCPRRHCLDLHVQFSPKCNAAAARIVWKVMLGWTTNKSCMRLYFCR